MTGQGDRCWIGARQLRGAKLSLEPAGGGDRVGNAEAGMQPLGGGAAAGKRASSLETWSYSCRGPR